MGKILETKINRFDGGIVNDPKDPLVNTARMVSNFDILSNPHKMTPYRSSEAGVYDQENLQKQTFALGIYSGSLWGLFALGVKSGATTAQVSYKTASDLDDSDWNATSNNESSSGTTGFNLFVFYAKTGKFYGTRSSRYVWSYAPTSPTWTDTARDLGAFTNNAQGVVHSKDDILYVPYDNKIASNNNDSWTDAALTLPSQYYITSLCEYGNYLAIACAPVSGVGNSRVYLWDRDSSLATISDSIDWGSGNLKIIEEIDGFLFGISSSSGTSSSLKDVLTIRILNNNRVEKLYELNGDDMSGTFLLNRKQKINNRLYFLMSIEIDGETRQGLWSVGKSPEGRYILIHERTPNNDTAVGALKGFFVWEDYVFMSYLNASTSVYEASKTDDQASYTASAVWEKRFNLDSRLTKKLLGVCLSTEPLPSGGQIILEYKIDAETSWTTIFTQKADDSADVDYHSISHTAVNIESSGANLPSFKEISFRIESTGGAEITEFVFKSEIIDKSLV